VMGPFCYQQVIFGVRKGKHLEDLIGGFTELDFEKLTEPEVERFEKRYKINIKDFMGEYDIFRSNESSLDAKGFYNESMYSRANHDVFFKYLDEWEGISGDLINYIKENEGNDLIYIDFIRDEE